MSYWRVPMAAQIDDFGPEVRCVSRLLQGIGAALRQGHLKTYSRTQRHLEGYSARVCVICSHGSFSR